MWTENTRERTPDIRKLARRQRCSANKRTTALTASRRTFWAIALFLSVYCLAVMIVPSLCMLLGLAGMCPWLVKTGLVSQFTFLIASLTLMAVIGRGDLTGYGLRFAGAGYVIRAILISAAAMLVLISPMVIMALANPQATAEDSEGSGFGPEGLLQTILFVWLIASVCEEVFYRGLLQGFLCPLTSYGVRLLKVYISFPVAFCAVSFGLGHLCLLGTVPGPLLAGILISTTTAGFIAGYYREQTGSLVPAIAAHMTFNVVGTMVPLLLGAISGSAE